MGPPLCNATRHDFRAVSQHAADVQQHRSCSSKPSMGQKHTCNVLPKTITIYMQCYVKVRERDKAAVSAERRAGMRANMAFLEQQEADFKSGGQKGIGKFGKSRRGRS